MWSLNRPCGKWLNSRLWAQTSWDSDYPGLGLPGTRTAWDSDCPRLRLPKTQTAWDSDSLGLRLLGGFKPQTHYHDVQLLFFPFILFFKNEFYLTFIYLVCECVLWCIYYRCQRITCKRWFFPCNRVPVWGPPHIGNENRLPVAVLWPSQCTPHTCLCTLTHTHTQNKQNVKILLVELDKIFSHRR